MPLPPKRIDSHVHFWALARGDYGWLTPDLAPLYRDFGREDLAPLIAEAAVDAVILVQAAPSEAETHYLLGEAARYDRVAGVVGWVDMAARDAPSRIAALAEGKRLKGIRPMIHDIPEIDWMLRPELGPAFRALIAHDLAFDALVRPPHLAALRRLVDRHPDLRIVIDHGAKPAIAGGQFDDWAVAMAGFARDTPIYCKLSGLVTESGADWTEDRLRPYVDHLVATFSPARLLWGSDWPVVTLAASYGAWWRVASRLLASLDERGQARIFGGSAAEFYRL
ncbi:MAG TPA: amidohydrolase family protein [Stellaceae bacterium]|jgi:L-fuconolactonase|nr:amidohydrolase family protein [Stellaceae bacterium]